MEEKSIKNKEEVSKPKKAESPDIKPKTNVKTINLCVVLVRGTINAREVVINTLRRLNLTKKNNCIIVPNTSTYVGMIRKVKDYVTWGEINDEVLEILNKKLKPGSKNLGLNPPRKGYGKKGIKKSFTIGGALGNRKEKINDLIKRML